MSRFGVTSHLKKPTMRLGQVSGKYTRMHNRYLTWPNLSPDPQQDPYKVGRYMLCGSGVKFLVNKCKEEPITP